MPETFDQNNKPVPVYTKIGWVIAWAVMAIIVVMILRNCVSSVIYGSKTEMTTVDSYYKQGIEAGQEGKEFVLPGDAGENPVLRKAFNKGYREGMDTRKNSEKGS